MNRDENCRSNTLTRTDIDTEKKTISITQFYQRVDKPDVLPIRLQKVGGCSKFLHFAADLEDGFSRLYKLKKVKGSSDLLWIIIQVI